MKNLKATLLSLALVCLLAPASLAGDGTMTSGGDRTRTTPTTETTTALGDGTIGTGGDRMGDDSSALAEAVSASLLQLASWIVWP